MPSFLFFLVYIILSGFATEMAIRKRAYQVLCFSRPRKNKRRVATEACLRLPDTGVEIKIRCVFVPFVLWGVARKKKNRVDAPLTLIRTFFLIALELLRSMSFVRPLCDECSNEYRPSGCKVETLACV